MKISTLITALESLAPPALQETYDNAGLVIGDPGMECRGVLVSLDVTEEVIREAIAKQCNLIVAHHPIIFSGIKKIDPRQFVGKSVIAAIKNDIAIYAIHTNLDNIASGVNGRMAAMLGLDELTVLNKRPNGLKKLVTFVPVDHAERVRNAIFAAGAGEIGQYNECSFNVEGTGSFRAGEGAQPFVGEQGLRHLEKEMRIETIYPFYLEQQIIRSLEEAHPYEEVAFDLFSVTNPDPQTGSGLIGVLPEPMDEINLLTRLKAVFRVPVIRHTELTGRLVERVALCGGAGSFLITNALAAGADFYISADIKYHEFFMANDSMVIADIGHYESEQFTINLLQEYLHQKFPNFAVLKTEVDTNPVKYF